MAGSENQKYKLLYLYKILMEETDEDHVLTTPQLIENWRRRASGRSARASTRIWKRCETSSAWTSSTWAGAVIT